MNFPRFLSAFTLSLAALLLLGCEPEATPEKTPEQQLLDNLAGSVILPAQQLFAQHSNDLAVAANSFCDSPDEQSFGQTKQQWRLTMESWQAVKVIVFGPIKEDNKSWQIQFWPDKHNLIRRKLNELLESDEELTVERIRNASVVTRGLSALEYLLFDDKDSQLSSYRSDDNSARRCQLLKVISQNTKAIADSILTAWSRNGGDYITHFTHTGVDNVEFPDDSIAISATVDSLVTTVEAARDSQLGKPLGYGAKGNIARPYLSEAWRSRHSTQLLSAHMQAAKDIFTGGEGYGMDDYLKENQQSEIAERIVNQFSRVNALAKAAPVMFEGVSDESQRTALEQLYQALDILVKTLKNDLPPAMGVTLGFNANDGD